MLQGRGQGDVGTCAWGALSCRGFFLIESGTYAGKVGVRVGGRLIPSCCCFSCLLARDQKLNSNNHAKCVAALQSLPQLCSHPCSLHCFIISTSFSSLLLPLLQGIFPPHSFCRISACQHARWNADLIGSRDLFFQQPQINTLNRLITPSDQLRAEVFVTHRHTPHWRPLVSLWLQCVVVAEGVSASAWR